jgi:lipopolysaccharide/colanic/teichoic acid biosynthesis glycosyltransferase
MFDYILYSTDHFSDHPQETIIVSGSRRFWVAKRIFDFAMSFVLLPIFLILIIALSILNPFFNKGTLFFMQVRMGRNCKAFRVIKFRTMTHNDKIGRGHADPIEVDRITVLGRFLRKSRLDEIPQILNVFKGDMSLVGPRPDYFEHARVFVEEIPGYRTRHSVRPGISGLAQVSLGYAEGIEATRAKTSADQYYIENVGFLLDSKIVVKTVLTVLFRAGA